MTQFKSMNIKQNFMKRKLAKVRKKKKKREKKLMVTKKCITEVISDFDIPFTSTSRLIPFFSEIPAELCSKLELSFPETKDEKVSH